MECKGAVIRTIMLQADSVRQAWYRLRLVRLGEGYVIEKSSGARNGKPVFETYFRVNLPEAEEKYFSLLGAKIRGRGQRKYRRIGYGVAEARQLPLFRVSI